MDNYSHSIEQLSFASQWWGFINHFFLRFILHSVLISSVFMAIKYYFVPFLEQFLQVDQRQWVSFLGLAFSFILSAPFIWAMVFSRHYLLIKRVPTFEWILFSVIRWLMAAFLISILAAQFVSWKLALSLYFILAIILLVMFSRNLEKVYKKLEDQFVQNLTTDNGNNNSHAGDDHGQSNS